MRALLAEHLRRDGYDVDEEPDGGRLMVRVAAIQAFERTMDPFDLIVSDIRMPICSGLDIARGLRDAKRDTPVVLITGFGDEEARAKAHDLGAVLFDKPFDMRELRLVVRSLLQAIGRLPLE